MADSWANGERNLYGRMDFCYDGTGPAKLLEYNADTPTSLYESSIFQWVWLEQAMEQGIVPAGADQFNSLHERLVDALGRIGVGGVLHLACARDLRGGSRNRGIYRGLRAPGRARDQPHVHRGHRACR